MDGTPVPPMYQNSTRLKLTMLGFFTPHLRGRAKAKAKVIRVAIKGSKREREGER